MAQNVIEVVGTSQESFAKAAEGLIDKPLRFRLPDAFR
jgi:flavin-binding protein dodecin